MSADEAIRAAREIGLDGICFTEHDRAWEASLIQDLRDRHGFPVFRGVEVMLQGGIEMLVFGLNVDFTALLRLVDLRKMVSAAGGFMVYAHPFRALPEHAVGGTGRADPVLSQEEISRVDAIEGRNGHNREFCNQAALEMADRHGLKTTGGSDAHAESQIGTCVTVFERVISTEADLLSELAAGRFTSASFRRRETWSWREDTRTIERRWL